MSVRYISRNAMRIIKGDHAATINDKLCSVCRKVKPKTEFHDHPNTYDGKQSNCDLCTKMYSYFGARENWPKGYFLKDTESLFSRRFLTNDG